MTIEIFVGKVMSLLFSIKQVARYILRKREWGVERGVTEDGLGC